MFNSNVYHLGQFLFLLVHARVLALTGWATHAREVGHDGGYFGESDCKQGRSDSWGACRTGRIDGMDVMIPRDCGQKVVGVASRESYGDLKQEY